MIQIFSIFEHSTDLELALSDIELQGIDRSYVLAIPLNNRKTTRKLFDSLHSTDGVSLISTGAALGTALAVIGASVGYTLELGPIYWGLIGAVGGFIIGFLIDLFYYAVVKKAKRRLSGKLPQVILIIQCRADQVDHVEEVLWHRYALGVSRLSVT